MNGRNSKNGGKEILLILVILIWIKFVILLMRMLGRYIRDYAS